MKRAPQPCVALFTDSDVFAGTESYMLDLARELRALQVGINIACPSPSPLAEKAAADSIPVITIAKGGLIDRPAIAQCSEMLRSGAIDLIHANNGRTMLVAAVAVARAGRGACVATQHFLKPDHVGRRGIKAMFSHLAHGWVNRRTSRIIAISEAVRQEILNRHEAPDRKITVVQNGIAPPNLSARRTSDEVRLEFGLAPETPLVVCAARLQREKDIGTLILAMKDVLVELPDALCLIAGEGSERQVLQAAIREHRLENSIRLLGFRSDVREIIGAANVFVLPSLAEPFGLVILEAMAVGVPVIACLAGAPPEIVVDGETGLLAPPSSPLEMSGAICQLLNDRSLAKGMGSQGRERFLKHYTAGRMAQETLVVYTKALSNRGLIGTK